MQFSCILSSGLLLVFINIYRPPCWFSRPKLCSSWTLKLWPASYT